MLPEIRHIDDLGSTCGLEDYDVAVVIDVIRAFTVAPWILRQGARRLLLAPNRDTALTAQRTAFADALLLADGPPDPHFDLPNAPGLVARFDLAGRTVIQTTGNGTRGAHAVASVATVLCASFVTAAATARALSGHDRVLLLTTEGDEDLALADYLTACVRGREPDAQPYLDRVVRSDAGRECLERGRDERFPGVHPDDLARCLDLDAFDHALKLRPEAGLLEVELLS